MKPPRTFAQLKSQGLNRFTFARERVPLSPQYSVDKKQSRGTQDFYVEWDSCNINIPTMITDFLGYSRFNPATASNPNFISRFPPYEHPNFKNQLYAESLQKAEGDVPQGLTSGGSLPAGNPSQDVAGVASYDETKVNVNFSSLTYRVMPDSAVENRGLFGAPNESYLERYVTIHAETRHRLERVPAAVGLLFTGTDNAAVAQGAAASFVEGDVTITYHQIPVQGIPWQGIVNCVGRVDASSIRNGLPRANWFLSSSYIGPVFQTSAGRTKPNFLCLNPKLTDPYVMPDGNYAVDITYRFKFFPFGCNFFWRWDKGRFEEAFYLGGAQFYSVANFDQLFWG